jgi:phosphocarrier protein
MTMPVTREVTIINRRGLHARAAARCEKLAGEFDADIQVSKDGTEVSGLSIMGLMMLAAAPGTQIGVRATGNQARQAIDAIMALVTAGFDED